MKSFFLALVLWLGGLGACWANLLTVCASGCDYTTITAAVVAGSASTTIQINDNSITNESIDLTKNIACFQATGEGITWASSSATTPTLQLDSGLSQNLLVRNITLNHNTGPTNVFKYLTFTSGGSVSFIGVGFVAVGTNSACLISSPTNFNAANAYNLLDCYIDQENNSFGVRLQGAVTTAGVFNLIGTVITKKAQTGSGTGLSILSTMASAATKILNCDISGYSTGITETGKNSFQNCLIYGNTTDVGISGAGGGVDFDHCAFGQLSSLAGSTNCLFSITNPFCDPQNYYLRGNSNVRLAGVSITGVTDVPYLNGIMTLVPGSPDIGANAYGAAFCPGYGAGR